MIEGKKDGMGKEFYDNAKIYFDGGYRRDKKHCKIGVLYDKSGKVIFKGEWINGEKGMKYV